MSRKQIALLLLITIGALFVHGYHPAAEDGELYLPGIKQHLNPALYRFNSQFFLAHAHMTLFDEVVAASARISHLPLDYVIFAWHFACLFVFLLGCWQLSRICFPGRWAPWGSVALVAALLTIPVAGTALYIMDQYLNPRDLSTAGIMLVLAQALKGRFWRAGLGMLVIATLHPLMPVFGIVLLVLLYLEQRRSTTIRRSETQLTTPASLLLVVLPLVPPASDIYRRLLAGHDSYFLVVRWRWYEWMGVYMPLVLLCWLSSYGKKHDLPRVRALSRSLVVFGVLSLAAALVVCIPSLAELSRIQPMRAFHLIFILLFLLLGGVLAESLLQSHIWRWIALLGPVCLVMFVAQRQLFPASEHLELPGRQPSNPWVQAFAWIRANTPRDAIFALNPGYMALPGEDEHGFRAIAERSALASVHDNGGVSMFPGLAAEWDKQLQAQQGWSDFQAQDFRRLQGEYGVTWVILQRQHPVSGLACPYENAAVMVCRVG